MIIAILMGPSLSLIDKSHIGKGEVSHVHNTTQKLLVSRIISGNETLSISKQPQSSLSIMSLTESGGNVTTATTKATAASLLNYNGYGVYYKLSTPTSPSASIRHVIATYELNYQKGRVITIGIYSDDIITNGKFNRYFDSLLFRYSLESISEFSEKFRARLFYESINCTKPFFRCIAYATYLPCYCHGFVDTSMIEERTIR